VQATPKRRRSSRNGGRSFGTASCGREAKSTTSCTGKSSPYRPDAESVATPRTPSSQTEASRPLPRREIHGGRRGRDRSRRDRPSLLSRGIGEAAPAGEGGADGAKAHHLDEAPLHPDPSLRGSGHRVRGGAPRPVHFPHGRQQGPPHRL